MRVSFEPGLASVENWMTWTVEEYRSVKAEIQASLQSQQQIAAFGVTLLGALATLGVALDAASRLAGVVLAFLMPAMALAVTAAYIGEIERMVRAGVYIALIERRTAEIFGRSENPLGWEGFTRDGAPGMNPRRALIRYRGTAFVIVSLGVTPLTVSLFIRPDEAPGFRIALAIVVIIATYLSVAFFGRSREQVGRRAADLMVAGGPQTKGREGWWNAYS